MAVRKINESYDNLSVKDERVIRDVLDYIDETVSNLNFINAFVLDDALTLKITDDELRKQLVDALIKNGVFVYDTRCNEIFYKCQAHLNSIRKAISEVSGIHNSYKQ